MRRNQSGRQLLYVIIFTLLANVTAFHLHAQSVKKTTYDVTLQGSSNIHDWTMKSSGSGPEANVTQNSTTRLIESIQPLTFNLTVKSLKSKENLLNTRAYKALNSDKYPTISYHLTHAKATGNQLTLTGQLTIAGTTKDMTLTGTQQKNADGTVTFSGAKKFKMSEFKIPPPKYMMGVMKVYDDVTVNYSVRF
jgi:hypothetical protein